MTLPTVTFSELDPKKIEQEIILTYERISEKTLYPGDPVRLFLESLAYLVTVQNNLIDLAGRQNLLSYATKGHLDHIGLLVGTNRLDASKAKTKQLFTLEKELDFDIHIPLGTRVTPADTSFVFRTDETLTIQRGELNGVVSVTSDISGVSGNGFVAGQINLLIDPIAYVKSTENIETTMLGSEVESDDCFRERIQLAPESYSNAGSFGAYRYHALKAHQEILDVSVFSPKPGFVEIRPIGLNGEFVNNDVLEAIREKVSADDVRPLTDTVIVQNPEVVEYDISVEWYMKKTDSALLSIISSRVEAAFNQYILWQKSAIGRDVNPTKLISMLEVAGAVRVDVMSPQHREVENWQLAKEANVILLYKGLEE